MTKRLYVENVEEWKKHLSKERFFEEELEVEVIERGIVLPTRKIDFGMYTGGVCDENLNFVAGYWRKKGGGSKRTFNCLEKSYEVDRGSIVAIDEDVIFGGLLAEHFGHFLTECFCRLWYVIQNPDVKTKIIFVTTLKDGKHRSYTDNFFQLMGIDTGRIIYVDKPMQFRSITVPEQAQYDFGHLTKEFLLPYREIMSRIKPGNSKKLYLTRTGFEFKKHGNVHCFNEKYFEDFFKARGFEVVSPEKLKVEEQISLIRGADEIAANLGTLTHFGIFCKPGAKFIMINRTKKYISKAQAAINATFNLDYYMVDGSKNFMYADRSHGVCLFGANKHWKAFVADYFGEEISEDDDQKYFEEALDKYVDFWYEKYSDSKERVLGSLKEMCRRIVAVETPSLKSRPLLSYQTHISFKGWDDWSAENSISNDININWQIESVRINFPAHKVFYAVYWNETEGWSAEVAAPEMAGTTGEGKPIFGIKIRLDEAGAKKFDILYRVHKFDGTWTTWAKNGAELFSQGVKLNAIQIKLQTNFNC